jgi:DNA-binding response OmpR family regulator
VATILVVDDDVVIQELLRVRLETEGYTVLIGSTGSEGIDVMRKLDIDLMIIDIQMPEKGGIETLMELSKDFPNLRTIVITGHSFLESEAFQNIAKQYGASHIFQKPLDMEEFLAVVRSLVGDR